MSPKALNTNESHRRVNLGLLSALGFLDLIRKPSPKWQKVCMHYKIYP